MKKLAKLIVLICAMSLLTSCVDYFENNSHTEFPPAMPAMHNPPPKRNGSIYQSGYQVSLFRDRIAYQVGDILTIKLEERTEGRKKVKTKANKKASNDTSVPDAFGANLVRGLALNTNTDLKFDGDGESNQNNNLTGTISVTVINVQPNGNLMVQGESWVTINTGREYVQVTGIVRREDIAPDNTISSQRVANARIVYSGNGQVANATRGGILTQFLYKFWPY